MTQTVGKKLFLVVNPVSGKKLARHYVKGMMERFGEAGFVVTSVYTRKDENAYEIVRKIGGEFDLIVCVGGDGTLKETV